MLQERHGSGYKVYNLCSERPCYDPELFGHRVVHWVAASGRSCSVSIHPLRRASRTTTRPRCSC